MDKLFQTLITRSEKNRPYITVFGLTACSASGVDSTIAADNGEAEFSLEDDDDDDDDDDVEDDNEEDDENIGGSCDNAMIEETTANYDRQLPESKSLKVAEEVIDMKTFTAEDEDEEGNASYTGDDRGFPSIPGKRERKETPEVTRVRMSPDQKPDLSPPVAVKAGDCILGEPAASRSFPDSLGSSVARLESFVASVVATDRKRPAPARESCGSPPAPVARSVPATSAAAPPQPATIQSRSRHSKLPKTTFRTSKSPTFVPQSATGGRMNRSTRGPAAKTSLPPSFVSPLPQVQQPVVDQPLDLSTRSRRESQYLSPDAAGGGPSSLLSLERQFGKGSAIFDRIGTKAWAAPYCAAALRLGVQSLAFGGGLGLVSPPSPSPSPSRRPAPGRPFRDRETVTYPLIGRQQPAPCVSPTPSATASDVAALLPWAQPPESKRSSSSYTLTSSATPSSSSSSSHLHTNLRCGCGASMESLFALTVMSQANRTCTVLGITSPISLIMPPPLIGGGIKR